MQSFFILKRTAPRLVALYFDNHFGKGIFFASFLLSFLSLFGALTPSKPYHLFLCTHGRHGCLIWVPVHSSLSPSSPSPNLHTGSKRATFPLSPSLQTGLKSYLVPFWYDGHHGCLSIVPHQTTVPLLRTSKWPILACSEVISLLNGFVFLLLCHFICWRNGFFFFCCFFHGYDLICPRCCCKFFWVFCVQFRVFRYWV